MRRIVVVADMEGAAGIGNMPKDCFPWYPEYHDHGLVQLAGDVNAVLRGLRAGGIECIDICDMHFMGQNLSESQLEPVDRFPVIKLVRCSFPDWKFLEEGYDGAILLGFHAMAGTLNGFASHTLIPFLRVRVNGQPVGEAALIGWLCGAYNVPILMITGDEVSVKQAQEFLPSVSVLAVKKAKNREVAHCFPTEEVRRLIEERASVATQRLEWNPVYRAREPVLIEAAFRKPEEADLAAAVPGAKKSSPRVVTYKSEKYLEAFNFLSLVCTLVESRWFAEVQRELSATQEGRRIFGGWIRRLDEQWMRDSEPFWPE